MTNSNFELDGKEFQIIGVTLAVQDKACSYCFERGHHFKDCKLYIKRYGKKLRTSTESNEE
ncbi:MAG: hypothetical protein S4CHLAM20_04550 [Chlamydiia bacterium]|nr:hypothetical protein [Chlamydiia bacterium]